MECRTKTGLLLLMISEIAAIISAIVMYSIWYSIDLSSITSGNAMGMLFAVLPGAAVGIIGGLIGLIGAIFILIGRKEFGEKHRKFVFYAIIILVISIVASVAIAGLTTFMTIFSMSQSFGSSNDPSQVLESLRNSNIMTITAAIGPISAALGGLIWVFALYQLENKNGKTILFAALICLIVTSIVVGITSISTFENYINSEAFEDLINSGSSGTSSYSQLLSSYQWIGSSAIFSLIGNAISNVLLFIALYIPYKRITSGELVPVATVTQAGEPDRRCPNCGQAIPFDANICPYCSKRFDDYL